MEKLINQYIIVINLFYYFIVITYNYYTTKCIIDVYAHTNT